jgi:DNA-binding transcriptional regulator YiaG
MNFAKSAQNPIRSALKQRKIRLEQSKRGKKSDAFTRHYHFLSHGDPECPEIRQPPILSPKQIKALRNLLELKVDMFAAKLGVHPDTVKKYEAGSRIPSLATLRVMQLLQTNNEFAEVLPARLYFNQDKIYQTRSHLNVSQSIFARILGVETSTLRGWEISKRKPNGPSVALLSLAHSYPSEFVSAIIHAKAQALENSNQEINHATDQVPPSPPNAMTINASSDKTGDTQTTFDF